VVFAEVCIDDVSVKTELRGTMSPNKQIEREAKEALGIEIGRGKRVPKDRLKEFEAKVAALKVTAQRPVQQASSGLHNALVAGGDTQQASTFSKRRR